MILNDYERSVIYIARDFSEISAEDGGDILFCDRQERMTESIVRHTLTYKNLGKDTEIIPVFQKVTEGEPYFYMIPCVNYNGNEWGNCQEPKGIERDGKPWIFPTDRIGVAGCSVAELDGITSGLFSDNEGASVNSSASVFCKDGKTVQRVYFSHIEYPVVYLRKYVYGEPMIEFLTIKNGEELSFVCYSYEYKKNGERFGYGGIFDFVNTECVKPLSPSLDARTATEYNFDFIKSLVEEKDGAYISNMGFLPNGEHRLGDCESKYEYRRVGKYEIGWCGQNITIAEMLIRRYIDNREEEDLKMALGILKTWMKRRYPTGVVGVHADFPMSDGERIDSCNEGWLLWKLVWCCELLEGLGIDTKEYEDVCKGIAAHYLEYFPNGGFPQISNPLGEIVIEQGCAGTMLALGFLVAYKHFKSEVYFKRGKEAFDFYYDNFLANSIAGGGALDTYCIDKESAGPVLRSALLLYELTGDAQYIEKAKQTAYYLMTWTYHHDVPFPPESDCARVGVRTTGGTSVSTAHQHLDVWGAYYVPDMVKLYEITENKAFLEQAKILWLFTLQYISDGTLTLHGMTRAKGAQNEAVLHCNWNWSEDGKKGQLNDWLVSWVTTFQLDVYYALRNTDFFDKM